MLGQGRCLVVSIPDLCPISYFIQNLVAPGIISFYFLEKENEYITCLTGKYHDLSDK